MTNSIKLHIESAKFETVEKIEQLRSLRRFYNVAICSSVAEMHRREAVACFEQPERIQAVLARLEQTALLSKLRTLPPYSATDADLQLAHGVRYVEKIKTTGLTTAEGHAARDAINAQSDLFANTETIQAARDAAGATIAVTEMVLTNEDVNRGIAIVRPPGHHAETEGHSGFCFFNNVAIAAKIAIERYQ
jgi:acetoin utilization deacetylase AcuC-like enzyme